VQKEAEKVDPWGGTIHIDIFSRAKLRICHTMLASEVYNSTLRDCNAYFDYTSKVIRINIRRPHVNMAKSNFSMMRGGRGRGKGRGRGRRRGGGGRGRGRGVGKGGRSRRGGGRGRGRRGRQSRGREGTEKGNAVIKLFSIFNRLSNTGKMRQLYPMVYGKSDTRSDRRGTGVAP